MTIDPESGVETPTSMSPGNSLLDEYNHQRKLFELQPPIIQRFLEVQAQQIAESFTRRAQRLRFTLPDRIFMGESDQPIIIPEKDRSQSIGNIADRLAKRDVHITLRQRLVELESSQKEGLVISAKLIRYAAAHHIIHNMLPSGRSITYLTAEGEEIPSIPAESSEPESAITAESDAIVVENHGEEGRGTLQVPFVPYARRFFLPQWVAFDENGKLLVNSMDQAQSYIASMQKFLETLFAARSLAPYMVENEEFERKRYGMLGQLVNQGRAFAWHQTIHIIDTIKKRAEAQSLNRGLGLRLPYFDDQDLKIKYHSFVVIPAGRIMFIPAFVVRASQEEEAKVSQDTRLSSSTRKYLLLELSLLENEFEFKD